MSGHRKKSGRGVQDNSSVAALPLGVASLEYLTKFFLILILVFVPLMTAWAKEWSIAVLFLSAAGLVLATAIRFWADGRGGRWSLVPILLSGGACLLVMIQLVPLPTVVLDWVAPFQKDAFSSWPEISAALGGPSRWTTISLTPHLTASCLAMVCAYFMFVTGLWFYLRSTTDVQWLLKLIAVSAVAMASVGLIQLLFGNGKFLGLFENPMRSAKWPAKGTFTNQNHFASFLALGIGCCLMQSMGWKRPQKSHRRSRSHTKSASFGTSSRDLSEEALTVNKAWAAATMIVLLAAVLTFSRGGIAAVLIALGVACLAFREKLPLLSRLLLPAVGFCILGVLAFGSDALSEKWNRLVTSSSLSDVSAPRIALWNSLLDASPSFWAAGSGAGSHAEVYPVWMKEDFGKRFSHAENGYLQILVEMGLPGLLLLGLVILMAGRRAVRAIRNADSSTRSLLFVCAAGILASVLHSLVDFVWCIPGCLVVTLALLMSLFRSAELSGNHNNLKVPSWQFPWMPWLAMGLAGVIVVMGTPRVLADARSEGPWLRFRGLAINAQKEQAHGVPPDEQLDSMIACLESCLQLDPQDSRAMADLSILYLQRFEATQAVSDNPMSLAEIRSTVQSVGFESRREMLQWMTRAFGSGVGDLFRSLIAARASLSGQPLKVSPYLSLHQLRFLITDDAKIEEQLMDQVLRVRPHDPAVRYAVGIADLEAGRVSDGAIRLGYAFRQDPSLRQTILSQLMGLFPIEEVVSVIEPDIDGLLQIFTACRALEDESEMLWVAERFRLEFAEAQHPETFGFWFSASKLFRYLEEFEAEISCLKQALIYRPQAYSTRRLLAFRLQETGDLNQATAALRSCLMRKPDDPEVNRRLEELKDRHQGISSGLTN